MPDGLRPASSAGAGSDPLFACVASAPSALRRPEAGEDDALGGLAADFSPRFERHGSHRIVIDVRGLDRLLGRPAAIAEELRRMAAARHMSVHIAVASTWTAATLLAVARRGVTVVDRGREAAALADVRLDVLDMVGEPATALPIVPVLKRWGLRTLGELAALPAADLSARFGRRAAVLQARARGEDARPLVPDLAEERFEGSFELEWPVEELEPLSFVLTRLLEPLAIRLERHDRGAAVLHVALRLVTREVHARRLELPSPIREVRALRTLALLDLEAHPPPAGVDRVEVTIEPTPGRILQHTLFARPYPSPEQLATLIARLGALIGQDRIGAPATIDSYRPDGFETTPYAVDHLPPSCVPPSGATQSPFGPRSGAMAAPAGAAIPSVLRRCRPPVPARVAVEEGRPVRVASDRRAFAGGAVRACAGPWRSSGEWWSPPSHLPCSGAPFSRDEWDVALSDGAVYRVFQDRDTGAWFIDGIVD
jgi:protein ImuB